MGCQINGFSLSFFGHRHRVWAVESERFLDFFCLFPPTLQGIADGHWKKSTLLQNQHYLQLEIFYLLLIILEVVPCNANFLADFCELWVTGSGKSFSIVCKNHKTYFIWSGFKCKTCANTTSTLEFDITIHPYSSEKAIWCCKEYDRT